MQRGLRKEMAKTNYERGRNKEYRIVKKLKARGFDVVVRSAGSHSPIDIWALDWIHKNLVLVQSKLGKLGKSEKERILKEGQEFEGLYSVSFELWD